MWRIFRWLDRHEPSFYKFSIMVMGLAAVAGTGFLLGQASPAAGVIFIFAALFALMRASHVYRFEKKERTETSQSRLPIAQASDDEVVRRVRRRSGTEAWRRRILSLRDEKSPRGDLARSIIKRWENAGMPEGKPIEPKKANEAD